MCQIIIKPKGKLTNLENLDNAQERNHDGYGVMYYSSELRQLVVYKTLDYKEFRKYIEDIVKDDQAVIHLRFASRGKVSIDNVHPFETSKGSYLCHNGTLTSWGNTEVSDTQEFASTMKDLDITWEHPATDTLLKHTIGTTLNKIVVMKPNGYVKVFNLHLFVEEEGILYSNTNHKKVVYNYPKKYNSIYDDFYDYETERYSHWWDKKDDKKKEKTYKVFVYGTLKEGESNHEFLSTAKFLGKAETVAKYAMVNGIGFPFLLGYNKDGKYVKGEVYEVDEDTKEMLDILEGVPTLYVERKIFAEVKDANNPENKKTIEVIAYVYAKTAYNLSEMAKYSPNEFLEEWSDKSSK